MTKRAPMGEIMVELDDRHIPVQVMMNEVQRRTYQAALQEADFALHDAAGVLALLRDLVAQSAKMPNGVASVLNVCAKLWPDGRTGGRRGKPAVFKVAPRGISGRSVP